MTDTGTPSEQSVAATELRCGSVRRPAVSATVLRWLLLAALFASFPIALFIPMGTGFGLVFHVAAPWFTVLTLAGLGYLAVTPARGAADGWRSRGFALVLWLSVVLHIVAALVGRTADWFRLPDTGGMVVLTALFAVAPRAVRPRRLDVLLGLLWGVQVLHCGLQILLGYEPVALAGNRNWAATLVAVLGLWACHALRRVGDPSRGLNAPVARLLLQAGVVAISAALVYACHCRATWLALGLYALVVFLLKPSGWLGRVLVLAALLLVAFGAMVSYPEKVGDLIERDIRLPLFGSSLRMVRDHPVLGVGPGNFTRDFVAYRSTAQKARAVAAPVSEHPHCELLSVALAAGIPGAVLWSLAMLVPLWLPTGRSSTRRLLHASLWLLVVHGFLDKVLVQPPTSVLAVFFAGLLWRPWLRLRADPRHRPAALARLAFPVAVGVTLLGLYVVVRDVGQGWLFRRAYMAESAGQHFEAAGAAEQARAAYAQAYAAYAQSTRIAPRAVRTHAYAAICANNKLRDPERALAHLHQAMALEPDFAHLNGEAGLALGSLGRHEDAFAFFAREAQLFPFDIEPRQRLLLCAAATGRTNLLPAVHTQLLANSVRRIRLVKGESEAGALALSFRVSLVTSRLPESLATANSIVAPTDSRPAEPPLYAHLARPLVEAVRLAPFGSLDSEYWQELEATRQRWMAAGCPPVPTLAVAARAPLSADAAASQRFLDTARFAGYTPACLLATEPHLSGRFVELRRGPEHWLLDLERGEAFPEVTLASLLTQAALAERCGVRSDALRGATVLLPAHPLQFLYRTQALGAMVRETTGKGAIPFAFSPLVEGAVLQAALADELRAAGLPPDSLTVVHDQARMRSFAGALQALRNQPHLRSGPLP